MAVMECCRLLLYLIEWIWTTVILGIFPNKLTTTVELNDGTFTDACLFNLNLGRSRCDFGIAWAAIAFIVLTSAMIWYCMEYCTPTQFPTNVETVIFSWLTVWWVCPMHLRFPATTKLHKCIFSDRYITNSFVSYCAFIFCFYNHFVSLSVLLLSQSPSARKLHHQQMCL